MSNKPQFVRLSAQAKTARLRTETYKGDEHIVVPAVMLVGDIVVEGMNSEVPEFVPADVLAAAPSGLNGRPVVNVHPADGKEGANTPERWETECFGQCWNSHFTNGALQTELWLNRTQAENVGPDAVEVIDKALAGEMFEVSIGAWVWLIEEEGVAPDGSKYGARWQTLVHDHAAAGLQAQGGVGACGVDRGCGGPRVLSAKQAEAIKERSDMSQQKSLLHRLAEKLGEKEFNALAEGMSDNDLRRKLNKALRATVPAFWGVDAIYMDSSTAIYTAMPGDSIEFYECSFSVEGDNVTIGRRKRVEPVTEWKKVAASAGDGSDAAADDDKPELKTNCRCHENTASNAGDGGAAHKGNEGERMSDKKKELVGRLTANAATKLTADADTDKLMALSEEQLEAMVALVDKPAVETVKEVVKEPTPDPNLVTLSKDQVAELTQLANREREREKAHRASLVKSLVDSGVCKYTEAQLAKKDTDDLQLLAESLGLFDLSADGQVLDYTGRGQFAVHNANASSAGDGADDYAPPDAYGLPAATATALGYRAAKNVQ